MRDAPTPIEKDLVLVGGGHAHVSVIKRFGMEPIPGVRVTLVCRDVHTPYSGMLPGLIAGHYTFDEAHIDLRKLARFAAMRFIHDEAIGLDLAAKTLRFRGRPDLPYDLLAIDIGSSPARAEVPGADEYATAVKPISKLVKRWDQVVERVLARGGKSKIGVVGAGAAGVEVLLAMQHRLGNLLREAGLAARPEFHVFGAADDLLPTHNVRVRRKFHRVLSERGVEVHLGCRIVEVTEGCLISESRERFEFDEILWTTQASAQSWPAQAGLAVDQRGFIEVDDTLQSISHPGVFASGDVASMVNYPREKAGVFAVRQGPPLERNLRRLLQGLDPAPFQPQEKFLSLVSTGDRYAVGSRSFWAIEGAWVWRWKDHIDRKFMNKFGAELPSMEGSEPASGDAAARSVMRCHGCGSKIGSNILRRALARVEPARRDEILIGLDLPDDAAVIAVPAGKVLAQTTDFFSALVDDPFVFGKIAAEHALGDLFAMGAEPHSALATAVVPPASDDKLEQTLADLLAGANEVLLKAGAVLIGGHSSEGDELALGLAVNGFADPASLLRKGGLQAGDRLILTKPIGTGTLFAAEMRMQVKGRWIAAAVDSMLQSNRAGVDCLRRHGATACTDVSGFGLIGHLAEMTLASSVAVELDLSAVPILEGARDTAAAGFLSSLDAHNRSQRHLITNLAEAQSREELPLLFDPQTCGGLLAGVPDSQASACLAELHAAGYAAAAIIGSVTASGAAGVTIRPANRA